MDFKKTKLWYEFYGAIHGNPIGQLYYLATNEEAKNGQAWQAGLDAAKRGDLAAVRTYFSRDEVRWNLSRYGSPENSNDVSYLLFYDIAAQQNNIELAKFVLAQGVRPYSFEIDELKKNRLNNDVTALLEKHVYQIIPRSNPGAPKP